MANAEIVLGEVGGGGEVTFDYDFVKNIVDSHTQIYSMTPYNSRVNINESGIYKDPISNMVYMYGDFTTTTNVSIEYTLVSIAGGTYQQKWNDLFPQNSNSGTAYFAYNFNISERTAGTFKLGIKGTDGTNPIIVPLGSAAASGTRFKFYGMWMVNKV